MNLTLLQELLEHVPTAQRRHDIKGTYDTVFDIIDRKFDSSHKHNEVQRDSLSGEGSKELFYVATYRVPPGYVDVEAYVIYDKSTKLLSFLDDSTDEVFVDGKGVGQYHGPILNEIIDEYNFSGVVKKGACEALYKALKELA